MWELMQTGAKWWCKVMLANSVWLITVFDLELVEEDD